MTAQSDRDFGLGRLRIEVGQNLALNGFDLYVILDGPDGKMEIAEPGEFKEVSPTATTYIQPTLCLRRELVQHLMDELWRLGVRPQDGAGSLAHVEAMKAHIADLRQLLFAKETEK